MVLPPIRKREPAQLELKFRDGSGSIDGYFLELW